MSIAQHSSSAPAASSASRAHRTLLPYFLVLLASSGLLQLVIALTGNRIGLLSGVLTAVIGIGYALYLLVLGRPLSRVRYGLLVAHALTYVAVNTGFSLHAYVLLAIGSPAIAGPGWVPIDPGWMGAALAMPAFWGLGLLMHGFGALIGRGFEASS